MDRGPTQPAVPDEQPRGNLRRRVLERQSGAYLGEIRQPESDAALSGDSMARVFDVTVAADAVRLDAQGRGDAAFTVANVSGRRIRGRGKVVAKDPATAGWISIAGTAE